MKESNKSYVRIIVFTLVTGITYRINFWLTIPFAVTLAFCIMNHCDYKFKCNGTQTNNDK